MKYAVIHCYEAGEPEYVKTYPTKLKAHKAMKELVVELNKEYGTPSVEFEDENECRVADTDTDETFALLLPIEK